MLIHTYTVTYIYFGQANSLLKISEIRRLNLLRLFVIFCNSPAYKLFINRSKSEIDKSEMTTQVVTLFHVLTYGGMQASEL